MKLCLSFYHKRNSRRTLKTIYLFRRKTEKYNTFTVPIEKKVTRIDKNGEEITKKVYLTYYNLLIVQGIWQAHYQVLPIIFLTEFIQLSTVH